MLAVGEGRVKFYNVACFRQFLLLRTDEFKSECPMFVTDVCWATVPLSTAYLALYLSAVVSVQPFLFYTARLHVQDLQTFTGPHIQRVTFSMFAELTFVGDCDNNKKYCCVLTGLVRAGTFAPECSRHVFLAPVAAGAVSPSTPWVQDGSTR